MAPLRDSGQSEAHTLILALALNLALTLNLALALALALAHTLVLPHQVDNWKERLAGGEFDPDATEMLTVMQQQQERKQARQPDATPGPAPNPNPAAPSHARP